MKARPRLLLLCSALVLLGACASAKGLDARLSDPGPVQEGGSIPVGGPETGTSLPTSSYELLAGGTTAFAGYRGRPARGERVGDVVCPA